jgi:hypothetical protein
MVYLSLSLLLLLLLLLLCYYYYYYYYLCFVFVVFVVVFLKRKRTLPCSWGVPSTTSPFFSIWILPSLTNSLHNSRVISIVDSPLKLRQSCIPLNTCSRGISDGQHVFSLVLETVNRTISLFIFARITSIVSSTAAAFTADDLFSFGFFTVFVLITSPPSLRISSLYISQ